MKDDTIYRQAAIEAVEYITSSMSVCVNTDECHGMKRMQRQAVIELTNLPSAKSERKVGHWIDDCTCSVCHWIHEDSKGFALLTNYSFCPNCGTRMDKKAWMKENKEMSKVSEMEMAYAEYLND